MEGDEGREGQRQGVGKNEKRRLVDTLRHVDSLRRPAVDGVDTITSPVCALRIIPVASEWERRPSGSLLVSPSHPDCRTLSGTEGVWSPCRPRKLTPTRRRLPALGLWVESTLSTRYVDQGPVDTSRKVSSCKTGNGRNSVPTERIPLVKGGARRDGRKPISHKICMSK